MVQEDAESPQSVRNYLSQAVKALQQEPRFFDVLPGFVLDDERAPLKWDPLLAVSACAGWIAHSLGRAVETECIGNSNVRSLF